MEKVFPVQKRWFLYGWTGFFLALLFSCNIGGTNWDVDVTGPVMETTLDFTKMVGPENLDVAPDSALTLHFEDTVYSFDLDTFSHLPLTDVLFTYNWNFPTIAVPPGTSLPTQNFVVSLDMEDVQLLYSIIKSGQIRLLVKSKVPRKLKFRYYIPLATRNGNMFEITDSVMAAGTDTSYFLKTIDATGYQLDLRGQSQTQVNRLDIFLDVTLDAAGDTLLINNNSFMFEIRNEFLNILPFYGKGYLGQYAFQSGNSEAELDVLDRIRSGYVDIDDVTLDLQLINRMGADIRFKPYSLKAINERTGSFLLLNHPSMGNSVNINRAVETGIFSNPVTSSIYTMQFNSMNSNLEELIELLPNKLILNSDLFLNPYGNMAGYDDFFYYDYPSLVKVNLTAPLKFAVNDIWFVDTLDNFLFDEEQLDQVASGEVRVRAENKFPLNAVLQVYTVDAAGLVTDSLLADQEVAAAPVNSSGRVTAPVLSVVNLPIDDIKLAHLKEADRLIIKAFFVTLPAAQLLQMYEDYYLKVKLIGDIRYNIEL